MKSPIFSRSGLHNKSKLIVGGILFFIGLICSVGFNGLAAVANINGSGFWGDSHDATTFDSTQPDQAELVSIHCPVLLAPGEEKILSATFENQNQEKANILVKVVVSKGDFVNYRELAGNLSIEPGEEQAFRWQISQEDIVGSHFILSRVFLMNQKRYTPYPVRTLSCGIFIMDLFGLNGTAMVVLFFLISLVGLGGGSVLIYLSDSAIQKVKPRIDYGLYGLAGILLIAMIANLFNWWIIAGLILLLAVILITMLITEFVLQDYR
jgi:hypothetical protein